MDGDSAEADGRPSEDLVPPDTPLAAQWGSLHAEDQAFALLVLDVLEAGEVDSHDQLERFVDAALDLQPAVDEGVIDQELVRRIALAIVRAPAEDDES